MSVVPVVCVHRQFASSTMSFVSAVQPDDVVHDETESVGCVLR